MLRRGQHAMRDTSLLKGKQQRTTFAAAFSGKAARPCCVFLLIYGKQLEQQVQYFTTLRGDNTLRVTQTC